MMFHRKMVAGTAILVLLSGITPICNAGQVNPGEGASGVAELLRLLQKKGVISKDEAGELEKKFTPGPSKPEGTAKQPVTHSAYAEVTGTIESLREQDVISAGEAAELLERADVMNRRNMGETVAKRPPLSVGAGDIWYGRTTIPLEEVQKKLRLLAYRKVMTRDEAAAAYRRFGVNYTAARAKEQDTALAALEVKPPEQTGAPAQAAEGDASAAGGDVAETAVAPFAYEEAVEVIDALGDQGIVSDEETEELKARADALNGIKNGETPPERQRRVVGAAVIPYRRTTAPLEDMQDDLSFLIHQKIMSSQEAADAYARFRRKYPTDQLAENISDELGWEVRYQVDQKMDRVANLEKKNARLPEWLERFRLSGDLRLRYQGDFFDKNNEFPIYRIDKPYTINTSPEIMNTTNDRQRFRLRARLRLLAEVTDNLDAVIGLATGSTSDPVSTNVTLGDGFNKKTITLDTAYLKWTPLRGVVAWGGRIPNPWFSTDLVWDRDLNFDGFAVSYAPVVNDELSLFVTGGVFPLQEVELSGRDKWLFGGQVGVNYRPTGAIGATLGVAYYRFENTQGHLNETQNEADNGTFDYTVPTSVQKGNTYFNINRDFFDLGYSVKNALASKFQELNITGSLDIGIWHPIHLVLMGDYVINLGYDSGEVDNLLGGTVKKENTGYQIGFALGYPDLQRFGDWRGFLNYRYLGADAVMDAFTDSDFHLGGTNAKGWTLGGDFGLAKNVWLTGKWMTAGNVSGEKLDIDVFQFDLNTKF